MTALTPAIMQEWLDGIPRRACDCNTMVARHNPVVNDLKVAFLVTLSNVNDR